MTRHRSSEFPPLLGTLTTLTAVRAGIVAMVKASGKGGSR